MFGELHIAASLRKDLLNLLYHYIGTGDLSFSNFKIVWKARNFSSIHACKVDKFGYRMYLQLLFEATLLLLQVDVSLDFTVVGGASLLSLFPNEDTRKSVWNVGVLYCLYTIYNTQTIGDTNKLKSPVNIGFDMAFHLATAVKRLCTIAEFGRTAVSMYQSLLKSEAFRLCTYTGPTCMFYCQKARKAGSTVVSIHPMTELIESANRIAVNSSSASSSSSNSNSSSINHENNCSSQGTDFVAVNIIKQYFTMGSPGRTLASSLEQSSRAETFQAVTNPSAAEAEATTIDGSLIVGANEAESEAESEAEAPPPKENADEPPQSVTEYLAQSIPARRQMRANRVQERLDKQQALDDARVERLRLRVLKRLEKHDFIEPTKDSVRNVAKQGTKLRNSRRSNQSSHKAQEEEGAEEDAPLLPPRRTGPGRISSALSAPPTGSAARSYVLDHADAALATSKPNPRGGRKATNELSHVPDKADAPRLLPRMSRNGRHLAEARAEHDDYLQENEDLMQDFEEFVGLRSKSTRSAAAAVLDKKSSSRSTRSNTRATGSSASPEPEETHLDAASGDIMDIMNQLEKDSQHVLQRRTLRSSSATVAEETASSAKRRQARNAPAAPNAAAGQKAHLPVLQNGTSDLRKLGSGEVMSEGVNSLELREVNKRKRKAVTEGTVPAAKRAKANQQVPLHTHKGLNHAAPQDVMLLLQRLEQESERILTGAAESDSLNLEELETQPKTRRRGVSATNIVSAQASAEVEPTRAPAKRKTTPLKPKDLIPVETDTTRASSSAPPLKKQRVQRVAPSAKLASPAVPTENDDITAVLQRLERESDQVLTADSSAENSGVMAAVGGAAHTLDQAEQEQNPISNVPRRGRVAKKRVSVVPSVEKLSRASGRKSNRHVDPSHFAAVAEKSVAVSASSAAPEMAVPDSIVINGNASSSAGGVTLSVSEPSGDSGGGGVMDIMEMLRQLEEEASAVLNG